MFRMSWTVAFFILVAFHAVGAELQLRRVDRISSSTEHCAFTDLVRFHDQFYCTWREATSHMSYDGKFRVVRSPDGTNWTSVCLITRDGVDLRDSKLSVTPDDRLMLYGPERYASGSPSHRNLVWLSADGTNWTDAAYIAEDNIWFWKCEWKGNVGYGVGYHVVEPRFSRLYTSTDATNWTPHVTTLFDAGYVNESALVFMPNDRAYCLHRRDSDPYTAHLGTALPPYTNWTWKDLGVRVGGPEVIRLPDNRLLAAVRLYDTATRTALCWIDPEAGILREALTLPSGGDTSYAGMVWYGDRLWVSYYSSHESGTGVYLAEVTYTPDPTAGAVYRHEGANHPVDDEDWALFAGDAGEVVVGPVTNEPPDGLNAWKVDDNGTDTGTRISYLATPSLAGEQVACTKGWALRMRLRVTDPNDAIDFSVHGSCSFTYPGLDRVFSIGFGTDADGNLRTGLWDGGKDGSTLLFSRTATVSGSGYHLCELIYDPDKSSADLWVDGTKVLSDYPGMANAGGTDRIVWGSNQSASTGQGNYNLVEFWLDPLHATDYDGDADGIPDPWEYKYGGTGRFSAGGDRDGDHFNDDQEWAAGTVPTNRLSALRIEEVGMDTAGYVLQWQSVTGKYYRIERGSNLLEGLPESVADHLMATPPLNVHTDATVGTGPAFYRVRVE